MFTENKKDQEKKYQYLCMFYFKKQLAKMFMIVWTDGETP
jgi:hypothetical protein